LALVKYELQFAATGRPKAINFDLLHLGMHAIYTLLISRISTNCTLFIDHVCCVCASVCQPCFVGFCNFVLCLGRASLANWKFYTHRLSILIDFACPFAKTDGPAVVAKCDLHFVDSQIRKN